MKSPGAAQPIWRAIANTEGEDFFRAQHDFIRRTHYDPAVAQVRKATGLDLGKQSDAVRQAVWSTSVNHGAAPKILGDAVNSLDGKIAPSDPAYQQELIKAIYQGRRNHVTNDRNKDALTDRYNREEAEALRMQTPGANQGGL